MTKKQMHAIIKSALAVVDKEIGDNASGGMYAAGLASEGYAGGYRDALHDMQLMLNGVIPNRQRYYRTILAEAQDGGAKG